MDQKIEIPIPTDPKSKDGPIELLEKSLNPTDHELMQNWEKCMWNEEGFGAGFYDWTEKDPNLYETLEEEMKVVKDYMDHWFHGGGKLKAKEWKKQLIAEKD